MRFVVGIDPGSKQSAYVLLCSLESGASIARCDTLPNDRLLELLRGDLLMSPFTGDEFQAENWRVACEWLSYMGGKAGGEIMDTCRFVGRIEELCAERRVAFSLHLRTKVKQWLCGSSATKDADVRYALARDYKDLVEIRTKTGKTRYRISGHEWSALAVALKHEGE